MSKTAFEEFITGGITTDDAGYVLDRETLERALDEIWNRPGRRDLTPEEIFGAELGGRMRRMIAGGERAGKYFRYPEEDA